MAQRTGLLDRLGGRQLLFVLGGLYLAAAAGYPFVVDTQLGVDIVMAVLVGGPGALLVAAGSRLTQTTIRPELYATVARWTLGGIGVMLGLLALVSAASALRDLVQNLLILTAIGSVAGLAAGLHDARAKSRTLELRETVEQLRTANQRLEQFAYATSHDLQEPLRMVSSFLRLLESRYRDDLDQEAAEYIDFAVNGADRMRAMVDSLLEYSRVTPSSEVLEPTDSRAVLDDVLGDLRLRIEEADATVTVDDLPTVVADPEQLGLLFENLLSNAIRFSGDEPPRVHVSAESADDFWRFAVADEGVGVAAEYHDRLFDVFETFHASDEPGTDAGGIGLALCERIVERHGGDIWVESEPGEGSTFYFTMPAADDVSLDATPKAPTPQVAEES